MTPGLTDHCCQAQASEAPNRMSVLGWWLRAARLRSN